MSLTLDFSGRTVIVTGAAQGIGYGIAQLFAAAGARVAPFDLGLGCVAAHAIRMAPR